MNLKPAKPFYIALLLSILIHLGLLLADFIPHQPPPLERKPLTVEMMAYSLEGTAQATTPEQTNTIPTAEINNPPPKVDADTVTIEAEVIIEADEVIVEDIKTDSAEDKTDTADTLIEDEQSVIDQQTIAKEVKEDEIVNKEQPKNTSSWAQDLSAQPESQIDITPITINNPNDLIAPLAGQNPSFPHHAVILYEGPYSITGEMKFSRSNDQYQIHATFNIPFNKMEFISEGKLENNRLIPLKYTDMRKGKVYASAIFDYENKVTHYGKGTTPDKSYEIKGNQLDFFSWAWQIAISGGYMPGITQLTNGKNVYEQFLEENDELAMEESLFDTNEGKIRLIMLAIDRQRQDKQDAIEYGFAPDFANIPALINFTDKGKTYQLRVIGITLDDNHYWKALRQTPNRKK